MTNDKNQKHIQTVYADKASNLLKICMAIFAFSILTYVYAIFILNSFDFGLIFEAISLLFIIMAYSKINQRSFAPAKRNTIIAMVPVGWLIIYDFIHLLINIQEVMEEVIYYYTSTDQFFYWLAPYLFDVALVLIMVLLFKTLSALSRADGSKQATNYVDNFYDRL